MNRLNPWYADFDELYRRHLCRHASWSLNALHLVAVAGIYFSLFGMARGLPYGSWLTAAALAGYFAVVGRNISPALSAASAATLAAIAAVSWAGPQLPLPLHAALVLAWHRLQTWSHRFFRDAYDMSEFAETYRKGALLFVLLSLYELPLLLERLVFSRKTVAELGLTRTTQLS
jgi:hypothetical protein